MRRFGWALLALGAVAGAALVGVLQGRAQRGQEFGPTPSAPTAQAPFRSNQEQVRGQPAPEVFAHTCGTCHTLRAAGVTGGVGPDLDRAPLTAAAVRRMIRTGSADSTMPANLLVGRDADRVARYVARVSRASGRARGLSGQAPRPRAITICWISSVPSPMVSTLASR